MKNYYQIIQEIYQKWIVEHTQNLVSKTYSKDPDFSRLLRPLRLWKNRDYQSLSALCEIEDSTLKRILGYTHPTRVSPKNEARIAQYLGYANKMEEFTQLLVKKMYRYIAK